MNTKIPVFKQITKLLDSNIIRGLSHDYNINKHNKGLDFTSHLNTMLFSQLGGIQSLRDITNILKSTGNKSIFLGIKRVMSKSSLAYHNANKPWEIFQDIYMQHYAKYSKELRLPRKKLNNIKKKILIIDSSMVTLCASIFDWAPYYQAKGGIKLHTILNYHTFLPEIIVVGSGKTGDNTTAREINIPNPKNALIVGDKAYSDTRLLKHWDDNGVMFVVRAKSPKHIKSIPVREIELPDGAPDNILIDEVMSFVGQDTTKNYKNEIRRVVVYDPQEDRTFDFWTNNLIWTAEDIADIYQARWNIETFFKNVKQNLNIKSFLGTSSNAVMIQIWISMIVMLLLTIIRNLAKKGWPLSNIVVLLKLLLLNYQDLSDIINRKSGKDPPNINWENGVQTALLL
jgi:hypothetical protein